MDISNPSSDKEVRVLTQDDSPQHHNENKQNQLTLRSAMDLFDAVRTQVEQNEHF